MVVVVVVMVVVVVVVWKLLKHDVHIRHDVESDGGDYPHLRTFFSLYSLLSWENILWSIPDY